MGHCIPYLDRFNFNLDQYNRATLNSTFELYKSDIRQVFKLFKDLLASLPHIPEHQRCQWDIASFVAATATLMLSTYNTVQISKLETAIETQKQKTDLLADIVLLHEQHLHKLDKMIEDMGMKSKSSKFRLGFTSALTEPSSKSPLTPTNSGLSSPFLSGSSIWPLTKSWLQVC
jgi:hypothetical protein